MSCETRTSFLGSVDGSGATHEHFTYMWIVSKEGLCRVSLLRNQFCRQDLRPEDLLKQSKTRQKAGLFSAPVVLMMLVRSSHV